MDAKGLARERGKRRKKARVPGGFPDLLTQLREKKGYTQKEMGLLLGMPELQAQSNYGKYERGENTPRPETLRRMETLLETPPGMLVDAVLGPGAYAFPERLRESMRPQSPRNLDVLTEISDGLKELGREPSDEEVERAIASFFANLKRGRCS